MVPHKGDVVLFEKTGNHIPLCNKDHNTITGKFDYNYKVGDSIEPKTKWMSDERARNEIIQSRKFPSIKVLSYYE